MTTERRMILRAFEKPDEVREFEHGRFELVRFGGVAAAAFSDGRMIEMKEGQLFYIPAEPHDSWVVGDRPYISLHLLGATHYAR